MTKIKFCKGSAPGEIKMLCVGELGQRTKDFRLKIADYSFTLEQQSSPPIADGWVLVS
jgi:hypothetical protein